MNKLISRKEVHVVPKLDSPVRLSDYVPGKFKAISSKKGMKKAIDKRQVKVNGIAAIGSKYINGGETIEFFPETLNQNRKIFKLKINVIFEDEHIAVVEKPAGVLVSGNQFKTLENALLHNLSHSKLEDACVMPKPAHRLDFPTSGLLLIAKTASSVTELNKKFESRTIDKTYHAITIAKMKKEGTIESKLKGKDAVTKWKVLKTVDSNKFEVLNLVKLTPITGRRHQLRQHMLELGNPILGDVKYAIDGKILKGKGLFLHASQLGFNHPSSDETLNFELELPKKFHKIFNP